MVVLFFLSLLTSPIILCVVNGFTVSRNCVSFLNSSCKAAQNLGIASGASTLYSSMAEKNKIVGGGFVLVPPGNLELFDPDTVGLKKGSGEIHDRINSGLDFSIKKSPPLVHESSLQLCDAQNWLEHLDDDLPLNIFKNTAPSTATILGSVKIIGDDAPGDM